jgi:hypothetical protein
VIDEAVSPVRGKAGPADAGEMGDHVAPEVERRRTAMEEDHRRALSDIDIAHLVAADRDALARVPILSIGCHYYCAVP